MSFSQSHKTWLDGGVEVPTVPKGYSHTDTDPKDCPECKANTERAYAESAALLDGHRHSAEAPGIVETLEVIAEHLRELTALQRRILEALGSSSDSRSSIEIKTSTRGVDAAAKAYSGSDIGALVTPAVDAYFATLADVQRRLNGEVPA